MTVVPTNESKEIIEKSEKLWSKIRDLIRSVIINSNENYIKTKFDSVDDLTLNKTIEFHNVTIVVRTVFCENKLGLF